MPWWVGHLILWVALNHLIHLWAPSLGTHYLRNILLAGAAYALLIEWPDFTRYIGASLCVIGLVEAVWGAMPIFGIDAGHPKHLIHGTTELFSGLALSGTMLNPMNYSMLLALTIPSLVGVSWWLAVPVLVVMVITKISSAWGAAVAGLTVLALFRWPRLWVGILLAGVVVAGTYLLIDLPGMDRLEHWSRFWGASLKHPLATLIGYNLGASIAGPIGYHAFNEYLEALLEGGVVLVALLSGLTFRGFYLGIKGVSRDGKYALATMAAFLVIGLGFPVWHDPVFSSLGLLVLVWVTSTCEVKHEEVCAGHSTCSVIDGGG